MDVVYTYCNRSILFSINILLLEKNMPWIRKIFLVTKYQRIKPLKKELNNLTPFVQSFLLQFNSFYAMFFKSVNQYDYELYEYAVSLYLQQLRLNV